jgi:site-specific DNA recombinase
VKVALYIRVSTDEQAKSGYSLPDQRRELRRHVAEKGYEVVQELIDDGYSGANPNRPGLMRAYELAESGAIDVVLATRRDRLFRSRLLRLLADQDLEDYGVRLVALNDTNSRIGDGVQDDYAEYERELFVERSRAGKRQKARNGETCGSGTPPHGFKYSPDRRTLEVDETAMSTVRRIFEMVAGGHTLYGVSKIFNEEGVPTMRGERWYTVSMRRMLWNDAYKGVWHYGRERVTVTPSGKNKRKFTANPESEWIAVPVPDAGIPQETIERARNNLTKNYRPRRASKHYYELKGLVFCDSCGLRMTTYTAGDYRYYICQKRRKWGIEACDGPVRTAETARKRRRSVGLENEVMDYVQKLN